VIALVENNPRALQSNSAAVSGRFSDGNVPLNGQRTARAAKARPTIEELREYLDYEPETGVLRWKKAVGRIKAGEIAGGIGWPRPSFAYWKLRFKGCMMWGHRVAFALHHGRWPEPQCDHIDGNGLNNRADNLRECSRSQNNMNRNTPRTNKSSVKGVYRHADGGYVASVQMLRKQYRKYFRHLEDAAAWAKQLREQLHGEFARH
jgi:hypothetical protein